MKMNDDSESLSMPSEWAVGLSSAGFRVCWVSMARGSESEKYIREQNRTSKDCSLTMLDSRIRDMSTELTFLW